MIRTAILTISDKGYKKERDDTTGPAIKAMLPLDQFSIDYYKIIPDEYDMIAEELTFLCDNTKVNLVLTNGGTGFSKRDVTPEATISVLEKQTPGITEAMRAASLKITPNAMLSRATSGIRKNTLIINLPGSPKGAVENLQVVLPALPHGIGILIGEAFECGSNI